MSSKEQKLRDTWRALVKEPSLGALWNGPGGGEILAFPEFAPKLAYIWERQIKIASPWLLPLAYGCAQASFHICEVLLHPSPTYDITFISYLPFSVRLLDF